MVSRRAEDAPPTFRLSLCLNESMSEVDHSVLCRDNSALASDKKAAREEFMRRCAIALVLTLLGSVAAQAQDTVKIVVPFAAGGPVDAMARLLAQEMQGPLGTSIVVENRAGGGRW